MSETAALNDDFAYAVLSAVAEIPEGYVATYGQLARLIGYPKNARLVARVLSHADYYGRLSLSPRGKCKRPPGPRLGSAGHALTGRRRCANRPNTCGP